MNDMSIRHLFLCFISLKLVFGLKTISDPNCAEYGIQFKDNCYVYNSKLLSYDRANMACQANGGTLPIIRDAETELFIRRLLHRMVMSYWIGIKLGTGNTWIYVSDQSEVNYTNWDSSEPDYSPHRKCVQITIPKNFKWWNMGCVSTDHYVCQYSGENCKQNQFAINNICYELSQNEANLTDADAICRSKNGKLAEPKSQADMDAINEAVFRDRLWINFNSSEVHKMSSLWSMSWIGVRYDRDTKNWVYDDESKIDEEVIEYLPDEPSTHDEDCAQIYNGRKVWSKASCVGQEYFICQYKAKKNSTSPISTDSYNSYTTLSTSPPMPRTPKAIIPITSTTASYVTSPIIRQETFNTDQEKLISESSSVAFNAVIILWLILLTGAMIILVVVMYKGNLFLTLRKSKDSNSTLILPIAREDSDDHNKCGHYNILYENNHNTFNE